MCWKRRGAWSVPARAAARAVWGAAVAASNLRQRWSALTILVRVLARAGNRMGFERARRLVGRFHLESLPPASLELDALLETARGLARFGERAATGAMLGAAATVVRRGRAADVAIRIRRAAVECESLAGRFDGPDPDPPAELQPLLARLAAQGEPEGVLAMIEGV